MADRSSVVLLLLNKTRHETQNAAKLAPYVTCSAPERTDPHALRTHSTRSPAAAGSTASRRTRPVGGGPVTQQERLTNDRRSHCIHAPRFTRPFRAVPAHGLDSICNHFQRTLIMADRITDKHLQALCDRLNTLTNSPMKPWSVKEGADRHTANIGNYHISGAYGGVCLNRMVNESGGVTCPLMQGHVPKRALYDQMRAMIAGIEAARESKQ